MQLLSHTDMMALPTRFPGADARVIDRATRIVKGARYYIRDNPNAEFALIELPALTFENNAHRYYPYSRVHYIEWSMERYYREAGVRHMMFWHPLKEWKKNDDFERLMNAKVPAFVYAGFPEQGDATVAKMRVGDEHPWDQWGVNLR